MKHSNSSSNNETRSREGGAIVLVDNKCEFCSRSANFIIRNGGEDKFNILSLYSDKGRELLAQNGFPPDYNKSLVLIDNDRVYTKSTAVLRISKKLNGLFPLLYSFIVVPKIIRDPVYDLIARHRHRLLK